MPFIPAIIVSGVCAKSNPKNRSYAACWSLKYARLTCVSVDAVGTPTERPRVPCLKIGGGVPLSVEASVAAAVAVDVGSAPASAAVGQRTRAGNRRFVSFMPAGRSDSRHRLIATPVQVVFLAHAEPARERELSVPAPARGQPCGVVAVERGGVRRGEAARQAGVRIDRLCGVSLV